MHTYPEHEKLEKIAKFSQSIGAFIEGGKYLLAEYVEIEGYREAQLLPVSRPLNEILAEYFDIDLDKIEEEKRQMLDCLRNASSDIQETN